MEKYQKKSEIEISRGNLSRAKEILELSLGNYGFSVDIFYRLGSVNLLMKNDSEAGYYFLLSGIRDQKTDDCIKLYKSHNRKEDFRNKMLRLPKRVRMTKKSDLPTALLSDLHEFGLSGEIFDSSEPVEMDKSNNPLGALGCVFFLFVVVAIFVLGVIKAFSILGKYIH